MANAIEEYYSQKYADGASKALKTKKKKDASADSTYNATVKALGDKLYAAQTKAKTAENNYARKRSAALSAAESNLQLSLKENRIKSALKGLGGGLGLRGANKAKAKSDTAKAEAQKTHSENLQKTAQELSTAKADVNNQMQAAVAKRNTAKAEAAKEYNDALDTLRRTIELEKKRRAANDLRALLKKQANAKS